MELMIRAFQILYDGLFVTMIWGAWPNRFLDKV